MSPPATIPDALFATAERGAGEFVFHLEDGPVRLPCAELAERSVRGARRLVALGVQPGDAVGVLGPNRPEWALWAFAAWICGAAVVPIQIPLRVRDPAAFREQLRSLVAAGRCRRVLADPALAAHLPPEVAVPWDEDAGDLSETEPAGPEPDSVAVIQFTSGSTSRPKGALIDHEAVFAQMEIQRGAYDHEDGTPRTIAAWTPFFHDLGLFANLVRPAVSGATVHQLPTERFARDPAEWLRLIESTRATFTAAPSTAYGSALRSLARRAETPDLSSLDAAYFGAEAVDPDVARRMTEGATALNLAPQALGSSYGMAETVMVIAYTPPSSLLGFDRIDLAELTGARVAAPAASGPARELASCGRPLTSLRIAGRQGEELAERHVGEIQVRGASRMSGYLGSDVPDPYLDGWLRTGDLGYLADGELYVTGRRKDVMIATGHNHYPEDFEWAAGRVSGVRPGRCVAFGLTEPERVVVLVEASGDAASARLGRRVRGAVADAVGVTPSEVVVLPPGSVEKTTSGKLRRAAMRDAYLAGALEAAPA